MLYHRIDSRALKMGSQTEGGSGRHFENFSFIQINLLSFKASFPGDLIEKAFIFVSSTGRNCVSV